MDLLVKGMEMPESCDKCRIMVFEDTNCAPELYCGCPIVFKAHPQGVGHRPDYCPLVPIADVRPVIDVDALTEQMERNLWAIEDKAEKELGFDETLRRGIQYGHAVCLNAVNDAAVVFMPQIVHCCECEYNNHCLTQAFVEEASRIPFDKKTWFCADAKVASTTISVEGNLQSNSVIANTSTEEGKA